MKTWLCLGDKNKNIPKCNSSKVEIKDVIGDWGNIVQKLIVYCNKKDRYVQDFVTSCDYFNNKTLEDFNKC